MILSRGGYEGVVTKPSAPGVLARSSVYRKPWPPSLPPSLPPTRRKPRDRRADLQAWPTPTTCGLCSPNLTTAPLGSRPSALGNCSHDNQPSTPKTGRAMSIAAESRVTVSCLVAPVTRDPTTRSCEMPGTEQQQQHTMCNSRGATYLDAQLLLRIHPRSGEDESGPRESQNS